MAKKLAKLREEMLAAISPELRDEVLRRETLKGDQAFLPSQVKLQFHRIRFPNPIGWVACAYEPEMAAPEEIKLIFVVSRPGMLPVAEILLSARARSAEEELSDDQLPQEIEYVVASSLPDPLH